MRHIRCDRQSVTRKASDAASASAANHSREARPPRRVVLLSRDSDFLAIYEFTLRESGYAVQTTTAPPECIAHEPDIVVVDVLGDGDWQSVAEITACGVPVAVVTGFISPDRLYRQRALAAGASAFVLKPVTWQQLNGVIDRVLAGERGIEIIDPRS